MPTKKLLPLLVLAVFAAALFGCGSGNDSSTTAEKTAKATTESASSNEEFEVPTTAQGYPLLDDRVFDDHVRYAADPDGELAYYVSEASASPGKIAFQFVNPQGVPHNVALEAPNGKTIGETETITEGATTAHFVVKPGVYNLYCSVPGHRKAGMAGHLTVK